MSWLIYVDSRPATSFASRAQTVSLCRTINQAGMSHRSIGRQGGWWVGTPIGPASTHHRRVSTTVPEWCFWRWLCSICILFCSALTHPHTLELTQLWKLKFSYETIYTFCVVFFFCFCYSSSLDTRFVCAVAVAVIVLRRRCQQRIKRVVHLTLRKKESRSVNTFPISLSPGLDFLPNASVSPATSVPPPCANNTNDAVIAVRVYNRLAQRH